MAIKLNPFTGKFDVSNDAVWGNVIGTLSNQADLQAELDNKVNLTGDNSNLDSLLFKNNVVKPAHQEGLVYYDKDEHALVVYNDESEIEQQIGREFYVRVFNNSGATISNGKIVQIDGFETVEDRGTISLAQADNRVNARVVGVATHDIENNTFGYITTVGDVNNIDTSAFNPGDIVYLSTTVAGELTNIIPTEGEIIFKIGTIIKSDAINGRLFVDLSDRGALTEFSLITDVLGTTWKNGLAVTENNIAPDQSVDFTNGEYFIAGILKEITPSGNLDLTSLYASLANDEKAIVSIYVDLDETLKTVIGSPVGNNLQAVAPIIPIESICIAEVTISKDELGNNRNILNTDIRDCRETLSKQPAATSDEFIRISDTDIVSKHLEEALNNNGGVKFTLENQGGDESLRADVQASDVPTDITNFNGGLSAADVSVQQALDTLDNLTDKLKNRTKHFTVGGSNVLGDNRTLQISTNGSGNMHFSIPKDFQTLVSLKIIYVVQANVVGASVDLNSDYGAVGEIFNIHSETQLGVPFSGTANIISEFDISGVFTNIAAGDHAGLTWKNNAIGTTLNLFHIELEYTSQ